MAFNDFEVVVYKTLAYLYECIKAGVTPNTAKARELTKVSEIYWDTVLESLLDDKLIAADTVYAWEGHSAIHTNMRITQRGATYVKNNPNMQEVAQFLGAAFDETLRAAIAATKAL